MAFNPMHMALFVFLSPNLAYKLAPKVNNPAMVHMMDNNPNDRLARVKPLTTRKQTFCFDIDLDEALDEDEIGK